MAYIVWRCEACECEYEHQVDAEMCEISCNFLSNIHEACTDLKAFDREERIATWRPTELFSKAIIDYNKGMNEQYAIWIAAQQEDPDE